MSHPDVNEERVKEIQDNLRKAGEEKTLENAREGRLGVFALIMKKHGLIVTDVVIRAAIIEAYEAGQRSVIETL